MSSHSNTPSFGSAGWLTNACRQNPEGLLLLAAGCALLFRMGGSRRSDTSHRHPSYATAAAEHGDAAAPHRAMPEGVAGAAEKASQYASDLGARASDLGAKASETARRYGAGGIEYAQQAGQTLTDKSGRIARQAQNTLERLAREQPLVIAAAGLAAGVAVAAAFPLTSLEREKLGPAGKRLSQAAKEARERLGEAAAAAGERFMNIAQDRGISAEGLKDVGRDVAGAFQKSLSGGAQEDDRTGAESRSPAAGSTRYGAGSM